jgi:hypothetical protein
MGDPDYILCRCYLPGKGAMFVRSAQRCMGERNGAKWFVMVMVLHRQKSAVGEKIRCLSLAQQPEFETGLISGTSKLVLTDC